MKQNRPEYDPDVPLVLRHPTRASGVDYAAGSELPVGAVAADQRRKLYYMGKLVRPSELGLPEPERATASDLDPTAEIVARKAFRSHGVDYAPGDAVPREALTDAKRRTLYRLGTLALAPRTNAGPRIEKLGGGWYRVTAADGSLLTPRAVRKTEAERVAAQAA